MRTANRMIARVLAGVVGACVVASGASAAPVRPSVGNSGTVHHVLEAAGVSSRLETEVVTAGHTDVQAGRPSATLTAPNGAKLSISAIGAREGKSVSDKGLRIYKDVAVDTDMAVLSEHSTVQFVSILNSSRAADTQRYGLTLPTGTRLEAAGSGFLLLAGDAIVGAIEAPWARDAAGRDLDTNYFLEGNVLVQHINVAGAEYPIVADPKISIGWYIYIRFNPTERREVTQAVVAAGGAIGSAIVCSRAGGIGAVVCGAVGAIAAVVIFEFIYDNQWNRPECGLEIRFRSGIEGTRLIQGDSDRDC